MKFEANPWQRFLILSMVFGETSDEREPMRSKAAGSAEDRNGLLEAGLIRVEQRGRAGYLVLEERAWDFVVENLGRPLPKTALAAKLLTTVLKRVGTLIETHGHSISEFALSGTSVGTAGGPRVTDASPQLVEKATTEEQIRAACLSLTGGQTGKRIRLADLRNKVPASREVLDNLLQSMQQAGRVVLYKMDNPAEVTPEDEQAALLIAGNPRHLVYLEV